MQRKKPKTKATSPSPVMIDREALTRLAYELYVRRGGEHGHELEDWLTAERILLEKQKSTTGRRESDRHRWLEDKFRFA